MYQIDIIKNGSIKKIIAKKVKIFVAYPGDPKFNIPPSESEITDGGLYFFEETGINSFDEHGSGGPYTYRFEVEI